MTSAAKQKARIRPYAAPRNAKAARPATAAPAHDPVNHPHHYTQHPSGVECIQITEHMGFNLGNVVKYIWRADDKGAPLEDLKKARFYLEREIQRREQATAVTILDGPA